MIKNTLKILCYDDEGCQYPFSNLANAIYKRLNQTDKLCVEIAFVSEEEIRQLNYEQRKIDSVTDVLSFPYLDGIRYKTLTSEHFQGIEYEEDGYLIGSICICMKRATEQAEEYGHSLEREVLYLALHGILHCFGYDHIEKNDEEEMTALAEEIMTELNVKRN